MFERGSRRLWAIVLAGGSGTRLRSLTRALYGDDLPKQFAVLAGTRSMLQATIDRALTIVPPERIVVVVDHDHELLARSQLTAWPTVRVLVEPRQLDTGPGLLLALAAIRARDPAARAVVLPSDHHVARPDALIDAIDRAASASELARGAVVLLGAEPTSAEPEYGWIVPARTSGLLGMRAVERFVEKPAPELAHALRAGGALWNTFVLVGLVEGLWTMARNAMPAHAAHLEAAIDRHGVPRSAALDEAYADLPPVNFSRAVLETARGMMVMPLVGAGWSDWGTPRRVFESLAGTPDHARLLARIAQAQAPWSSAREADAPAIS